MTERTARPIEDCRIVVAQQEVLVLVATLLGCMVDRCRFAACPVRPAQNVDLPVAQLREKGGHAVDGTTCRRVATIVVNDQSKWSRIGQAGKSVHECVDNADCTTPAHDPVVRLLSELEGRAPR
jgi:hypothetical protein